MRRLIFIAVSVGMIVAKPETYQEKEDFQYSRSSSDDGTQSGYYGAQRGNMGGNYEKAHNMDSLAQNQMSGLVRQVEGELGDGTRSKTGSVFSSANSRGMYGSGHYDLSNLGGRNFQEGITYGKSHQSTSSSHGSGYQQHSSSQSSQYSTGQENRSKYSGYQSGQLQQSLNAGYVESADQNLNSDQQQYGSQQHSGYYSQSGYHGQSQYDQRNLNQYQGYGENSQTRLIGATTPVKIMIRPGTRVVIPVAAQTYDASNGASYNQHTQNSEIEAEVLNSNNHNIHIKPSTSPKHYESSYRYHKEWEKHDTQPTVVPTNNPWVKNSELYEDKHDMTNMAHQTSNIYHSGSISNTDNLQNLYNQFSTKSSSSQAQRNSDYNARLSSASGSNANSYNGISNGEHKFDSTANANSIISDISDTKPKSYHSSYSYHKSWERQGDPYIIKPVSNGQASEKLIASNQAGYSSSYQHGSRYHQSHQGYSQSSAADCDCDENGNLRVIRSADFDSQQQAQSNYDFGQQSQGFEKLEDLGQQTEDFGQQIQQNWHQQSQGGLEKLEDLGQHTQTSWGNLESHGQQEQQNWHQQSQGGLEKLEDLGQQTQTSWGNLESHGQQEQQNWGQQSQGGLEKLEDLGQQTQTSWGNLESHGQQEQQNWGQQSQRGFEKLEDLGQQTQNTWDIHAHDFGQHTQNNPDNSREFYNNENIRPGISEGKNQHNPNNWDVRRDHHSNYFTNQQESQHIYHHWHDSDRTHHEIPKENPQIETHSIHSLQEIPDKPYHNGHNHHYMFHQESNTGVDNKYETNHNSQSSSQATSILSLWDKINNIESATNNKNESTKVNLTETTMDQNTLNWMAARDALIKYLDEVNKLSKTTEKAKIHQKNTTPKTTTDNIIKIENLHPFVRPNDVGRGDIGPEDISAIVTTISENSTNAYHQPTPNTLVINVDNLRYKTPKEIEVLNQTNETGKNHTNETENDYDLHVLSLNNQKEKKENVSENNIEQNNTMSINPNTNEKIYVSQQTETEENQTNSQQVINTGQQDVNESSKVVGQQNVELYEQHQSWDKQIEHQHTEQQFVSFGQQSEDSNQENERGNRNEYQQFENIGQQSEGFDQQNEQWTNNENQQFVDFGQQSEHMNQQNEPWSRDENQNIVDFGQQNQQIGITDQLNMGQELINFGQENKDLNQQNEQWNRNENQESIDFGQHNQQLGVFDQSNMGQELTNFGQQNEDLSQQSQSKWDIPYEDITQQTQKDLKSNENIEQHFKSSDVQKNFKEEKYHMVNNYEQQVPDHIEKSKNNNQSSLSSLSEPTTTTENPGFWKSVGNKFSKAKDRVASWFSRS